MCSESFYTLLLQKPVWKMFLSVGLVRLVLYLSKVQGVDRYSESPIQSEMAEIYGYRSHPQRQNRDPWNDGNELEARLTS